MRAVMVQALDAREAGDWHAVGAANMAFHEAIVALGDSERTSAWFAQVLAELRLILGLMRDPELLHGPSVERNQRILELVLANQFTQAAQALHDDLTRVERIVLALHARQCPPAG
jgi:DNA-binding GntR family transcriptional regulator